MSASGSRSLSERAAPVQRSLLYLLLDPAPAIEESEERPQRFAANNFVAAS